VLNADNASQPGRKPPKQFLVQPYFRIGDLNEDFSVYTHGCAFQFDGILKGITTASKISVPLHQPIMLAPLEVRYSSTGILKRYCSKL
jgi:hypothetical protein